MVDHGLMPTTVLIVDDHPGFRASARTLLEAEGFAVVAEAADGAEAIRMARALAPDLVILDVGLPDMMGFDVARRLSDGSSRVVLVSSRDAADFGGLVADCGAAGFVAKAEISGAAIARVLDGTA
jgi:DNA-binding NarL/FixJ family response regulator